MDTTAIGRTGRVSALLADYAILVDSRQAAAWAELFLPEGALVIGERRIEGQAALAEFAAASPRGVHVGSVAKIELRSAQNSHHDDGVDLQVTSTFVYLGADGRLVGGAYHDQVFDDGTTARFSTRSIHMTVQTRPTEVRG